MRPRTGLCPTIWGLRCDRMFNFGPHLRAGRSGRDPSQVRPTLRWRKADSNRRSLPVNELVSQTEMRMRARRLGCSRKRLPCSRDHGFESAFLQQTVRLSREVARLGREPRLFARVCGPWEVARSPETRIGRRPGADRRQCLCWAKFQYRGASDVVQGGRRSCRARVVLAQPVKRSRAPSVARAR